ncbi:hypothetical protein M885DRAFT_528991 [Pelagophyceae sp. CCMP2097]|nr:hypothetical protein M885DRAFT_528991 [Pelagophyceae sp. CCMP2097]
MAPVNAQRKRQAPQGQAPQPAKDAARESEGDDDDDDDEGDEGDEGDDDDDDDEGDGDGDGDAGTSASEDPPEAEEIRLDKRGRLIYGGGKPTAKTVDYKFQSWDNVLPSSSFETLRADCALAFRADARKRDKAYSEGNTFWVGADAPKTDLCALERLALEIFEFHAKKAPYDASKSGAEWWTLAMPHDGADVGWHWDRDYSLEQHDMAVTPHLSTVTYLSDVGNPTVITGLTHPNEVGATFACCTDDVLVSWPQEGKHASFDGRYLHSAPAELARASDSTQTNRVTLLVNVWLDHKPHDAVACALRASLSQTAVPLALGTSPNLTKVAIASGSDGLDYDFRVGDNAAHVKIFGVTPAYLATFTVPTLLIEKDEKDRGTPPLVLLDVTPAAKPAAKTKPAAKPAKGKPAKGKPAKGKPAQGTKTEGKPAKGTKTEGAKPEGAKAKKPRKA